MSTTEMQSLEMPTTGASDAPRGNERSRMSRAFRNPIAESSLSVGAFVILFAGYSIWLGSKFSNADARLLDVHQNVPILMLGLAVLVTLVAGLFDLSVAGMATLTCFLAIGLEIKQGLPFGVVLVICLAVGVLGGLINGLLVERLGVNTFIATLGTGGIYAGLSDVYSGGTNLVPGSTAGSKSIPTWFTNMGTFAEKLPSIITIVVALVAAFGAFNALGRFRPANWSEGRWVAARIVAIVAIAAVLLFGLSLSSWIDHVSWLIAILLATAAALWVLLRMTTYGRYLQASGANRNAARLAGVKVEKEVIKAFMIGGFLAALAGVLLAANQGSAAPQIAASFLLPAFAAAFLSTVVFSNGQFTVWGTILGGIFVVWVSQGLIVGGLPATWTSVVNGAVLILAVAMSTVVRRSR